MTWLSRYQMGRTFRWSLWLMPALSIGVALVAAPLIRWLDHFLGWTWFNLSPEGARTILPGSITALGTDDQNTYLLIGQEPSGKSLANDIAATELRLHAIMDNFRPLGEKQVMISGVSATERRFRGSVDSRDWSGVVVYIPHGARVYTIFGMTLADTDLVQIQENVISRAITSLQFTK